MASGSDADSRRAFEVLYDRFVDDLYNAFRWVPGAQYYGREDLVQDTFLRVYERADKFKETVGLALEQSNQRVMGWLCSNAKYLIQENRPRDRNGFVRIVQLTQECWNGACEDEDAPSSPEVSRVREVINALPVRERTILLLHMEWYDPELVKQRVPLDYVESICTHFGISAANYRQIVSRTLKKVEAALGPNSEGMER